MEATVSKWNTRDLTYVAIFAALIAICSWISVPTPSNIPLTLQTLGLFATMGILGGRRGTLAVLVYLLLGFIGVPVLAGFSGGVGAYLSASGGYLTGFIFTALLMWAIEQFMGTKLWVLGLSMVLGMVMYYAFGTAWFMAVYARAEGFVGLWTVLSWCVFPYIVPDCAKIVIAMLLTNRLRRYVK